MTDNCFIPKEVSESLDELSNHYDNFKAVNRGANGYLYFAKNKISKMDVAIKFYYGEPGEKQHDEPRKLASINSTNVLSILDARSISDEWGFFVTPRCFEGDLDDIIVSRPSVHKAIDIALGICAGVSAIHVARMLHRDLKPGNIVFSSGSPQIADFGSVRTIRDGEKDVAASQHSILYRPPESFETDRYSLQGDVYQIGLVTYQLLGGYLPYDGMQYLNAREKMKFDTITDDVDQSLFIDDIVKKRAQSGKLTDFSSLPPWIDVAFKRALRKMTTPNVAKRMQSLSDVAASLTQVRSLVENWYWDGTIAKLDRANKSIELRPTNTGDDLYMAYQSAGGAYRKVANTVASRLSILIGCV